MHCPASAHLCVALGGGTDGDGGARGLRLGRALAELTRGGRNARGGGEGDGHGSHFLLSIGAYSGGGVA